MKDMFKQLFKLKVHACKAFGPRFWALNPKPVNGVPGIGLLAWASGSM